MKQTIRFKGLTLNRDEQSADPGELALCGDMQLYDGALRPATFTGEDVAGGHPFDILHPRVPKLMYIHQTISKELFIYAVGNQLCYAYENSQGTDWAILTSNSIGGSEVVVSAIKEIKSVGNTLCIMMDDHTTNGTFYRGGIYYCLFDRTSMAYKDLGYKPPFLELVFNLYSGGQWEDAEWTEFKSMNIKVDQTPEDIQQNHVQGFVEESKAVLTDCVMSVVNKRIDKITENGWFYAPFLIRYCYRLFDGAMFMHSAPVLMIPMMYHAAKVKSRGLVVSRTEGAYSIVSEVKMKAVIKEAVLQMMTVSASSVITELKKWSDIVKSVDIFITPQFTQLDTSKKIGSGWKTYGNDNYSFCNGQLEDPNECLVNEGLVIERYFSMPEISNSEVKDKIYNASAFFKLTSIKMEEIDTIPTTLENLKFDSSRLKNITVQEQMVDDYKTHNRIIPIDKDHGGMYVYNHRLNVYGISEVLFDGFSPQVMFPYTDPESGGGEVEPVEPGLIEVEGEGEPGSGGEGGGVLNTTITNTVIDVTGVNVWIPTDDGTKKVTKSGSWSINKWLMEHSYCFYPDDRAAAMQFTYSGGSVDRKLESAAALNGAMSFFPKPGYDLGDFALVANTDNTVPMPNKIYTSRADNPFYFPNLPGESGINTVGVGEILGLAVATRALSAGQVGDHDLIVFCSDGIWVLKVSAQGTYSAIHNISREVCVNKESICQLDQSVVFATNRSLSRIVESDVLSLSDVLDGPYIDWPTVLQGLYGMFATGGELADADIQRIFDFKTPPVDFFREARVFYDYTASRIIALKLEDESNQNNGNADQNRVALVYSIRDHAWSMMNILGIKAIIPTYPSITVQYSGGWVQRLKTPYDYNETTETTGGDIVPVTHKGIIVTRTLTFSDTQDVLRGFRQMTDAEVMPLLLFYGSNDQRTWNYIGRTNRAFHNYMPGHPFRFFRIAIYFSAIKTSEEYQELILEIINKYAKL